MDDSSLSCAAHLVSRLETFQEPTGLPVRDLAQPVATAPGSKSSSRRSRLLCKAAQIRVELDYRLPPFLTGQIVVERIYCLLAALPECALLMS
jgi:hypothetical protein